MKFKKDAKVKTYDFFYDLTNGGYIKPNELLEDEKDIERINEAIETLTEFRDEMQDKGILEWL